MNKLISGESVEIDPDKGGGEGGAALRKQAADHAAEDISGPSGGEPCIACGIEEDGAIRSGDHGA